MPLFSHVIKYEVLAAMNGWSLYDAYGISVRNVVVTFAKGQREPREAKSFSVITTRTMETSAENVREYKKHFDLQVM